MAPGFFGEMSRLDADIIHLHMPNPVSELAYMAARARGKLGNARLVVTYHAEPPWKVFQLYRPMVRKILRHADRIVCYTKRYWKGTSILRDFDDKQSIIPHGLCPETFQKTDDVREAAADIRQKYGPRIVLFVGRLVYYKGLPELVEAMRHVDATLLIAGAGPLGQSVEELINEKGLGDKIKMLGRVDEATKLALYHACDVFTLPAVDRAEAYGQVILEAQACRKPVVTSSLDSGVSELNQDGYTGLTCPPGNSDALADALKTLLENPTKAQQFGEVAYQRFMRRFTREAMVRLTLDLYRNVLARHEEARHRELLAINNPAQQVVDEQN